MKKLLYLTVFVILTSIVSSCTEENITPQESAATTTNTTKL